MLNDRTISRRRFLGIALATPLLAAACSAQSPAAPAPTTAPAPTAAPAPTTAAAPTTAPAPAAAAAPGSAQAVELVFTNWNTDTYGKFREEEKVKLFNQKFPNVTINFRLFGGGDYHQKILTQLAGGAGADVFRIDIPYIYPFADQGTIPDISSRIREPGFWYGTDDCKRELYDQLLYRGKLYALGAGFDSNAIEVNLSLFDDAKIAHPPLSYADKGWDVNVLLEGAKQLTKRSGDTPTQYGINATTDDWQVAPLIWAFGGKSLSDDKTTLLWDQDPAIAAIQFMADLVNVHKVAPSPSGGEGQTFAYPTGKLAMYFSYPSQLIYRYNAKLTWNWDVVPEPPGPGRAARTGTAWNAWTMYAKGKHLDEAWEYTSFLAGPIATRVDVEYGWSMPGFKSLESSYYKRILADFPNKNTKPGVQAIDYSKDWYDPHMHPAWAEASRKYITPALDEVMLGKKTAAQAVKEFKPQVDTMLKEGAAKLTG